MSLFGKGQLNLGGLLNTSQPKLGEVYLVHHNEDGCVFLHVNDVIGDIWNHEVEGYA